jgi:hypothetical protein
MRLAILLCAAGLVLAAAPQAAAADGGPVPALDGFPVSAPGGTQRYMTLPAAPGRTFVVGLDRRTGDALAWRTVRGAYGVVRVTMDGATSGLSADAHTLVLAQMTNRWPSRRTRLLVLDPPGLRPRGQISLRGFFTIDAISPNGRWLYLIHYTHGLSRYEVRAYDLTARRLVQRPVVDPREPDEAMRGTPMTRLQTADGRWAYTLYQRANGRPFVHALDTMRRTAACIDLPRIDTDSAAPLHLSLTGGTLRATTGRRTLALIDTTTFKVTRPGAPRQHRAVAAAAPHAAGDGGGVPVWLTAAVAAAVLAGLAGLAGVRRRRATYAG